MLPEFTLLVHDLPLTTFSHTYSTRLRARRPMIITAVTCQPFLVNSVILLTRSPYQQVHTFGWSITPKYA